MSGVCLPATAVISLSCATLHGIAVTLTVTSGLSFWNCCRMSLLPSLSPSSPIAQTVSVAGPELWLVLAVAPEPEVVPPGLVVDPPPEQATEKTRAQATARRAVRIVREEKRCIREGPPRKDPGALLYGRLRPGCFVRRGSRIRTAGWASRLRPRSAGRPAQPANARIRRLAAGRGGGGGGVFRPSAHPLGGRADIPVRNRNQASPTLPAGPTSRCLRLPRSALACGPAPPHSARSPRPGHPAPGRRRMCDRS